MTDFDGIKGLGARRIELLCAAGIETREDLAAFFPIAYYDLEAEVCANESRTQCALCGQVVRPPVVNFVRRGFSVSRLACVDKKGIAFSVVYYNRPYLKNQFFVGQSYYFFGDLNCDKSPTILNPLAESVDNVVPNGFYTVYPQIEGIPRAVLKAAILDCVAKSRFTTVVPESLRKTFSMLDCDQSYRALHVPHSVSEMVEAQRTVAIEELTQLMLMFQLKKNRNDRLRMSPYQANHQLVADKIKSLPFALTADQQNAENDILSDLSSNRRMNRLIQGDVGSGKTVVAMLAMYYVSQSGCQAAIMSPTEVLARQHFQTYCDLFGGDGVVCLTGSLTPKEKEGVRAAIASGEAKIIMGTHSLFQAKCKYKNLALVVTDEQHRFGVAQRAAIEEKGRNADALIMSATPIPRTMALLLYGDLDVSVINEKPAGRKEIITKIVPSYKKDDMFRYLLKEAENDRRSYIVVPRVESDDDTAASIKQLSETLRRGVLSGAKMGTLYGSLKDKEAVLKAFSEGETKILLTTTVVEVGVDVRAACNIVVLDADRFGLSQLHQLRGRVGRGDEQSYCFLQTDNESESVQSRLKFLCGCSDGFEIADYDLETRGAGDFIGLSQHGFTSGVSHLPIDKKTIESARAACEELLTVLDYESVSLKKKYLALVQNVTMN